MKSAFVYVIGPNIGPQKIGVARTPEDRLRVMQTGCPFTLRLHHVEPMDEADAYRVERSAHQLLKRNMQRGEWFNVTPAEAREAVQMALTTEPTKAPASTDPLDRLYRHGVLSWEMLEAGLAYREVRREVSKSGWGRGSRSTRLMERHAQACAQLHLIDARVIREASAPGLAVLIRAAHSGEFPSEEDYIPLRKALGVVEIMLGATKCA